VATTDQLVTRMQGILSRRNDTAIVTTLIAELGGAQERLEREKWLPDFLYTREDITADDGELDLGTELSRYIRLHHAAGGITKKTTATDEPWVKLFRYDDREQLLQKYPGDLAAGSEVMGYFMVDTLVTLRTRPSVAVPQDLRIHFYQGEAAAPAVGNQNLWTRKAGDYLMGEAGIVVAQSLRDKEALAIFQGLRDADRARLFAHSTANAEADQEHWLGDKD
jgi:hypothetical protein